MIRSAYSDKRKCCKIFSRESLTQQQFKKECDINIILKKWQKTGMLTHAKSHPGQYLDCDAMSYHEALNRVISAQDSFNALPSRIRDHFRNDPAEFLSFVSDPKNIDKMEELGLTKNNRNFNEDNDKSNNKQPSITKDTNKDRSEEGAKPHSSEVA